MCNDRYYLVLPDRDIAPICKDVEAAIVSHLSQPAYIEEGGFGRKQHWEDTTINAAKIKHNNGSRMVHCGRASNVAH